MFGYFILYLLNKILFFLYFLFWPKNQEKKIGFLKPS